MATPATGEIWSASHILAHQLVRSGCDFVTSYPGSPTTLITSELEKLARRSLVTFRYAVNEKLAFEMAAAVALSGGRAAAVMKHVGLNVALDSVMALANTGHRGALLLVVGDDPSCESSSNEADSRLMARAIGIPCVEPSSLADIAATVEDAREISERTRAVVMLRLTTALCYSSGPVAYRRVDARSEPRELAMPRGEQRYRLTPAVGRKSAEDVHRRLSEARALAEGDGFTTTTEGDAALPGFIVSAMLHEPFRRACAKIGVAPSTWRTRMPWPVPTGSLLAFLGRHDEVVVIEEMEPLLEEQATLLAYRERLTTRIEGVDLRRRFGRLDGEDIEEILCKRLGRKASRGRSLATNVAPRPPTFCAGCPHTASFYSLKQVLESEPSRPFVASDIGCYTLGTKKGIDVGDVVLCMGASIGIATGAALAGERSIALIGDSTFLHAGLPALKNAVDQGVDLLVCVLDNGVAAMTGGQSTAESALAGGPALATAFSAAHVDVADPFDVVDLTAKVRRLLAAKGVTVLFVRSPCALERAPQPRRPRVDVDLCTGCGDCTTKIHCPAITLDENRKFRVDVTTCIGCGFCSEICPEGALTPVPYP